ncbi:MAG: DUF2332 family protein [Anderseniella sp.]
MTTDTRIRDSFAVQAHACEQLGSPFTARLLEGLGTNLDHATMSGHTILTWQGRPDALGDAVALRLAGALHGLSRRGEYPDLTKLYPPNPLPNTATLDRVALETIKKADADILQWLAHPPQTNEVARSAILYPGLMQIAAETGLPLSMYEIGCSAGLNLLPDRYGYRLGEVRAGQAGSPVMLAPDWLGAMPGGVDPDIVSRRGCDRNVLDVTDAAHAERIVSYVWPDQEDRINRVMAALDLARVDPPHIDQADAGDWIEAVISNNSTPGIARVILHSIAFQYFPEPVQLRITERIETVGAMATTDTPLAWLSFEQFGTEGPRLVLRLWPGDSSRVLAKADAHCRSICWC